ncbi:hypothetical protein BJ875DRAFT_489485 [Amylocarpus encephaloides]|uniref:Uncharacterized protein n=1 Tax=Amylocarpus encephaloides TaxID=45428 RepID=A0A9P7Y844_9HELO|nr:hypothetical protein BJ875DRAFT_489485 [Amylocarpus encephaloides]
MAQDPEREERGHGNRPNANSTHRPDDPSNRSGQDATDPSAKDIQQNTVENTSDRGDQQEENSMANQGCQNTQRTIYPSMTPQEKTWWAMSFLDLGEHAKGKGSGKALKVGALSRRTSIIRWLCKNEGITPYVPPTVAPVAVAPIIEDRVVLDSGAIPHSETSLHTFDPALQLLIKKKEEEYQQLKWEGLKDLASQRPYTVLKDTQGRSPTRLMSELSKGLAAWDVLKSSREKEWRLGEGILLVNKAKAMGYTDFSMKKYHIIVWLRSIPEDAYLDIPTAEHRHKKSPDKSEGGDLPPQNFSKRATKGTKRPNEWDLKLPKSVTKVRRENGISKRKTRKVSQQQSIKRVPDEP